MTAAPAPHASFSNAYADDRRAAAYAALEFAGTYHLAYRDLPDIFARHVSGPNALDFGCGTGRSTRFLRDLGFTATGIDISAEMLAQARLRDAAGRYRHISDGDLGPIPRDHFDLVLAAFTFDNIPDAAHRVKLLAGLAGCLTARGRLVLLGSTPEMYTHEWVSFSSRLFPENAHARSGDVVRVVITAVDDARPVADVIWFDDDYRAAFDAAGLTLLETRRPLATGAEPIAWVSETAVPPWVIYVLGRRSGPAHG